MKNKPSYPLLSQFATYDACHVWTMNNMALHMYLKDIDENLVKAHTKCLGKQSYCQNLTYKNWVWEREDCRIYISKSGVTIEVFTSVGESIAFESDKSKPIRRERLEQEANILKILSSYFKDIGFEYRENEADISKYLKDKLGM